MTKQPSPAVGPKLRKKIQSFFEQVYRKADVLAERLLLSFFVVGLMLGLVTGHWLPGLLGGGTLLGVFLGLRHWLAQPLVTRYAASVIIGIFVWQFAFQTGGNFSVELVAFLGAVALISYRDWRLQLPLGVLTWTLFLVGGILAPEGLGQLRIDFSSADQTTYFTMRLGITAVFFLLAGYLCRELEKEYTRSARNLILMKAEKAKVADHVEAANRIAQGDLDTELPIRNQDQLGKALAEVRQSLREAEKREQRERYINQGLAEAGELLRLHGEDMDELCRNLMSFLVKYLEVNQGSIYILERKQQGESEKEEETDIRETHHLVLKSVYAYDRHKHHEHSIEIGEGLAGQAVLEKQPIYMDDVPKGYVRITSGLGEAQPSSLLISPLTFNKEVEGVIEAASFHPLQDYQLVFMEKLSHRIASAVNTARVNQRTKELFEASQQQAQELSKKERKMKQFIEELKRVQDEMGNKDVELSGQIKAVDSTLAKVEFDMQGQILGANENFLHIMGYALSEIERQQHRIFCESQYVRSAEYHQFWESLRKGNTSVGEVKRITKQGDERWLHASYTPVKDREGNFYKVIEFAFDITEQKLASIDYEGQLKAINRSNAMLETDLHGKILDANDIFLDILEYDIEELQGKSHRLLLSPEDRKSEENIKFWHQLQQGEFVSGVFERITRSGHKKVLRGTYNPIFNMEGRPYKVVSFVHDITEATEKEEQARRQAELLQIKEEEMRTHLEQLRYAQEEMNRKDRELTGRMEAIDATLSTAQFDLTGKLIDNNEFFASLFGYEQEELVGMNHNELCAEDLVRSTAYKTMWTELRKGNPQVGDVKRYTRDGYELWLNASYTPVRDKHGKPYKIIMLANDITEQKKAALDFEGQLKAINTSMVTLELDLGGRMLHANDNMLALLGYQRSELINQPFEMLLPQSERQTPQQQSMWEGLRKAQSHVGVYTRVAKDGSLKYLRGSFNPILNPQGEPYKVVNFATDITLAQQQEQALAESQIELKGQQNALNNAAIVTETDLRGYIIYTNEMFCQVSGFSYDEVIGAKQNIVRHPDMPDRLFEDLWKTITRGEVWTGRIKNRKKDGGFYWVDTTITPVLDQNGKPVKYIGVRFDVTEQVEQEEKIKQQLEKISHKEEELRFQMDEMTAIQEEMENTEIELRGQQGALNAAAIVSETDLRGYITYVNDTFCEIAEYSRDELIGANHNIIRHPDMPASAFEDMWKTIAQGETWRGRVKNRKKNGGYYWVVATITPVIGDKGKPIKYIGVRFDITEQVEQEEKIQRQLSEIQANEEEMRQQMEEMTAIQEEMEKNEIELRGQKGALNAAATVSETDLRGYITYVNDHFCNVSGYRREELIGQNHNIVRHPDMPASAFEDLWKTIAQGKTWRGRVKNRKKSGEYYWVDATIYPVLDENNRPVKYIGVRFNITEQVHQEEEIERQLREIQANEEELRQQMEEMSAIQEEMENSAVELRGQQKALNEAAIVTETDLRGIIIYANQTFCDISGYTMEEIVGAKQNIVRHPDMPAEVFDDLWATITKGQVWSGRIKNMKKDGGFYWVQATITPVLGEGGKPVKYIGVRFDITRQVIFEEYMKERLHELDISPEEESRYANGHYRTATSVGDNGHLVNGRSQDLKAYFDSEQHMVTEVDTEGNIIMANPAYCERSGYPLQELVGSGLQLERHPHVPEALYADLWENLRQGHSWHGHVKLHTKSQSAYWADVQAHPVWDEQGQIQRYLIVREEITPQVDDRREMARLHEAYSE